MQRVSCSVLVLALVALEACGGAPLVLTEVPNRPSGQALIILGAERSGCQAIRQGDESLLINCPDGSIHVPVFAGPPTFAVRCLTGRLHDLGYCRARVRDLLLATDGQPPGPR
jgi:hypothetical protein